MTPHVPVLTSAPPPCKPFARVAVIPPGPASYWPILSRAILSVPTHWYETIGKDGRALLHVEPAAECPGCRQGRWVRWRAYLGVLHPVSKQPRVIELTPEAVRSCEHLDPALAVNLRGLKLKTWRAGSAGNSPLRCQLLRAPELDPDHLGTVDVIDTLCRLYGVERWVLDPSTPRPAPPVPPLAS